MGSRKASDSYNSSQGSAVRTVLIACLGKAPNPMDRKEGARGQRGIPNGWGLTISGRVGREAKVAVCEVPEAKGGPGKAGAGWLRWVTCIWANMAGL